MPQTSVPENRYASGTSWQLDSTPMYAYHTMLKEWMVMTHINAFAAYDKQWSDRGNDQFNSINGFMLMASHPVGKGDLMFRGMFSLEPETTSERGYPLLFQTGEYFNEKPSERISCGSQTKRSKRR